MWKIEITWKQLYEDIYVKFTKNESDQKTFIKEIFPDGLYQKMFVRSGKAQGKYVSLVCRATIDAKKRFLDAGDYLIQLKNEAHEDYNFEENPMLQEFAENWKRLVPACAETQENKVAKAVYRLIDKIEEEKELFKLLFMCDRSNEKLEDDRESLRPLLVLLQKNLGLSEEEAYLFHMETWICAHGMATMLATSFVDWDEAFISKVLTDTYEGIKRSYTGGKR